jgi:DNA-directed RNA polymerase specialized sigma24 family protein
VTLNVPEAKCKLHVAMRYWPDVDDPTAQFLRSLHWRIRRAVELTHGEECSAEQVAAQLRISKETVYSDLARAYAQYEEVLCSK